MLSKLSIDDVHRIRELAQAAVADRDRVVNKVYQADLGEQALERGSQMPTDLDSLAILDATGSRDYQALREFLDGLAPEQREEVKALLLIGRGDFAPSQWGEAMDMGRTIPEAGDVDYIAEKASLAQYLMKGLYGLKLG